MDNIKFDPKKVIQEIDQKIYFEKKLETSANPSSNANKINYENSLNEQDEKKIDNYEKVLKNQHIRKNEEELRGYIDDRKMKIQVYQWVKILINCYLFIVAIIVILKSFNIANGLTPPEIIALLTSTTATIIGLPYLMVSSLFGKSDSIKNGKNSDKI
jgi:hypothetical protein